MPRKKVYHCDMYYFNGVCQYRGEVDAADIRYRKDKMLEPRTICQNFGLANNNWLCPHCVENKKFFPPSLIKFRISAPSGRIVSLTPFQAKDSEIRTVKAYSNPKPLANYLKNHPELYGVDVKTGEIIGVDII